MLSLMTMLRSALTLPQPFQQHDRFPNATLLLFVVYQYKKFATSVLAIYLEVRTDRREG